MKSITLAGIDVSAKELVVCSQVNSNSEQITTFDNTPEGHNKLLKFLTKRGRHAKVCMEATGVYHFELAMRLFHSNRVDLSIVNPRAIKNFSDALFQRSKTDVEDAKVILNYLQRMPFEKWEPPAQIFLELRAIARRMFQLSNHIVKEKNREHAGEYTESISKLIQNDIEVVIRHHEKRIELLVSSALNLIEKDSELKKKFDLLLSVKGIKEVSAIKLLGELMCMPKDMQADQWVAHAGLDPRAIESGTSVKKQRKISKVGNKYLRTALYMPALTAIGHQPNVKAFRNKLVDAGKLKIQAVVAVMRKLLRSIWGMFNSNTPWNGELFYLG